jgi:transposase
MGQIHKRFSDDQVRAIFEKYEREEIERRYVQEILGIRKSRFFTLLSQFRQNPEDFSIQYHRNSTTRGIAKDIEDNIIKELALEKTLIEDPNIPIKRYNYSYIKDLLERKYNQKVSLSTIIRKAKAYGYYKPRKKLSSPHVREVLTNYIGELIQHDSSYHLWSPLSNEKWYLITSLDDFSRLILYAELLQKETTWTHIKAIESVFLRYGMPYSYYVDSHRIFRFVQGRDSVWRKHHTLTDEATPQWKQVLDECGVKVMYALSPQAKGKIERPFGWLQDRLIRTCVREDIRTIEEAQRVLDREVRRYNYKQVHSTTGEIPAVRFERALKEGKSLFREFKIPEPYESVKDVFCLRSQRVVNYSGQISLKGLKLKLNKVKTGSLIDVRIYPLHDEISELRLWCNGTLIEVFYVKNSDIGGVHF